MDFANIQTCSSTAGVIVNLCATFDLNDTSFAKNGQLLPEVTSAAADKCSYWLFNR